MSTRNILVTGMSGLIGNAVRNRLESKYTLRALNRRHISGLECYQADIVSLKEIQPAFDDQGMTYWVLMLLAPTMYLKLLDVLV